MTVITQLRVRNAFTNSSINSMWWKCYH